MPEIPFHHTSVPEDNIQITVFDIESIDEYLETCLDQYLCAICFGAREVTVEKMKQYLKHRFDGQTEKWQKGAVAEFFIHLYMKLTGYKQECLFLNLEENSIKKGFDGLYSFEGIPWLMESKSGSGVSHKSKVKEAFEDLKTKITTRVSNNPWQNAYNHAGLVDVGAVDSLLNDIRKMSDEFEDDKFQKIEEMNIIPCATVYLNGNWENYDHNSIVRSIREIEGLNGKKIHAICVTQKSYKLFLEYIGVE